MKKLALAKRKLIVKMYIFTVFFGILLVVSTILISRQSVTNLSHDLIGDRLHSDFNYINDIIGNGFWYVNDNGLYKGNVYIGDGTVEKANNNPFFEGFRRTNTDFYTFVKVGDEGLGYAGDNKTGYYEGHYLRVAGSTKGVDGGSIVGTYMDKQVADVLDRVGTYEGPANVNGRQIYCLYETLRNHQGEIVGAMVVGRSMEEVRSHINASVKKHSIVAVIVVLFLQIVLIIFLTKLINAIQRIKDYLAIMAKGKYPEEQLVFDTGDELEDLAESVNNTAKALLKGAVLSDFRQNMKRRSLFSICFDATTGNVVEGADVFKNYESEDGNVNYFTLERDFFSVCIDPAYVDILENSLKEDALITRMEHNPEFEITIRIAPGIVREMLYLTEESKKILDGYNEDYIYSSVRGVIVKSVNNNILVYLDVFDVHQKMVDAEAIKNMALTDSLTGLYNRNAFNREVKTYMEQNDNGGCLFMFDLDHFKEVNDALGHPVGDELLVNVAKILRGSFRENDYVCRLGGDEFCVFAKGLCDEELIKKKAEELNKKGRIDYPAKNGNIIHVSFSIGVTEYSEDVPSFEELYKRADKALYMAKESGRDRYHIG